MTLQGLLVTFVLLLGALKVVAGPAPDALTLGHITFQPGNARIEHSETHAPWHLIASTIRLFADRRDVALTLTVPEEDLIGTLSATRRLAILKAAKLPPTFLPGNLELEFSSTQPSNTATLQLRSRGSSSAFCPWTIETKLEGWDHPISIPAGVERSFPSSQELVSRFMPHPKVPHSKLLIECEGTSDAAPALGTACSVFLISADRPIKPIAIPEIRSALLAQGKGSGAALLPTALSGSVICEIRLFDPSN